MTTIFISYRREDTQPVAGRLSDHLRQEFGDQNVFRDSSSIPAGNDFRKALFQAIKESDVVLVLIGDGWLNAAKEGQRRLDDPGDYVRLEVLAALKWGVSVIPVIVEQANMPSAEGLPRAIRNLAFRQATPLRDSDFAHDVAKIVGWIRGGDVPGYHGYRKTSYLFNVILAVVTLFLVAIWVSRYTDWFNPATAAVLFPLLSICLAPWFLPRAKRLRARLEDRILFHRWSRVGLLSVVGLLFLISSFFGALHLTVPEGNDNLSMQLWSDDTAMGEPEILDAGQVTRPIRTSPWSPRELALRVDGYPEKRFTIRPWQRLGLTIPHSLRESVLLVRCDSLRICQTAQNPPQGRTVIYRVSINDRSMAEGPFDGRTICLGSKTQLEIVGAAREQWEEELDDDDGRRRYWFAVGRCDPIALQESDEVRVDVLLKSGDQEAVLAKGQVVVEDPQAISVYPQSLTIRSTE